MTVFGGMLAATIFGVVFIPVLYVVFQSFREWVKGEKPKTATVKAKTAKAKG